MNQKRTNPSYRFKVFKTEDSSLTRLEEGRFYPLLKYLGGRYGADPAAMVLDSLAAAPGGRPTYRIVFPENGRDAVVFAQRVDVYEAVDHNVDLDPVFEYYQLYAVSEKDADVEFDRFESGERSRAAAAAMSLIPGAGQLYKGHTFKGGVILGSEVALGAAATVFHIRSRYYRQMKESGEGATESFHSEEIGLRRLRNVTLGAMAGIWAFGIFDALTAESLPEIRVSASDGGTVQVAPASSGAGLALVYRF